MKLHASETKPTPKPLMTGIAAALSLALAGCTALVSTQSTSTKGDARKGVAYCLPMGKVTIRIVKGAGRSPENGTASRSEPLPDADSTLESAGTELFCKEIPPVHSFDVLELPDNLSALSLAQNTTQETPPLVADVPVQSPTQPPTGLTEPPKPPSVPATPPPAASKRDGDWGYWIEYVSTEYVPDPSKRFVVRYTPNLMSDDEVQVTVGKDSLLDAVEVKTFDRSVDVAKKLIEIGKNVARIMAQAGDVEKSAVPKATIIYEASFDPLNPRDLAKINKDLQHVYGAGNHNFSVSVIGRGGMTKSGGYEDHRPADLEGGFSGIAFRAAGAYDLVLKCDNAVQMVKTVILPNESETSYLPVTRSAFIERVHSLDFESGMLVKASLKKPSEILAAVEIPLEISKAILSLPGEIVGDNVSKLQSQDKLVDQQLISSKKGTAAQRALMQEEIDTLKMQIDLAKARKEFRDIQQGITPAPANPKTATGQ
jgi:hypothetical protein